MLEKFRAAKAAEIARLRDMAEGPGLPPPFAGPRPSFAAALLARGPGAVIAEYKRASPSKGDINLGLSPEAVADMYAAAGAAAISVLTEEVYFKGSLSFLDRMAHAGPPLLRKDFILDPLQVAATAATPASALLLIARMLSAEDLAELLRLSAEAGIEAVTEVFDPRDLDKAEAAGAHIIQVNNRDLGTLKTDLSISERLSARKRPGRVWISASGLATRADVERMAGLGFDAVLVGTSLMSGPDPGRALARMTGQAGEDAA